MLDLLTGWTRDCERVQRRSFLKLGALSGLGVSLPLALQQKAALAKGGKSQSDMSCILIWTHGGTSHHDTLDPKPTAPTNVKGEFSVIDTSVPGIQFTEVCPKLAEHLDKFALLRGWNPKNGSHGTADQWCMSGRQFNPALTYPCYGSVVSQYFGFRSALPPFVQLGDSIDRRFGGGTSGFLPLEHSPFEIPTDPNSASFTVRDITPPGGISADRVSRRRSVLGAIESLQRKAEIQPDAFDAQDENVKTAFNMITAPETKKAFEIDREDPRLRDRYGRTKFGQSCLMARRLIQAGVRFVTVADPGWDTHQNNFASLKTSRMPPIDQGLPELIIDLAEQGMLDTTLVVWLTDFGRTPKINSASGRDHWASAGFAVMAGAGVPGGAVLGATDEQGERPIRDEYYTDDIAATIYAKIGLPLDLIGHTADGRPIRLNEGKLIKQWM